MKTRDSLHHASFYEFKKVSNTIGVRNALASECHKLKLKGTIILSSEGINGSVSGVVTAVQHLIIFLNQQFDNLVLNQTVVSIMPFDRMVVKIKNEIVTSGLPEPFEQGTYVDPTEWNAFLEDEDTCILDVRNFYEHSIGSFQHAIKTKMRSFKEFPKIYDEEKTKINEKKIGIFCTGGIRCEKAAIFLRKKGLSEVFQLKGGILNYFKKNKNKSLWKGDCFVFDKRLAVNPKFEEINYRQCPGCKSMSIQKNQNIDLVEWEYCDICKKTKILAL